MAIMDKKIEIKKIGLRYDIHNIVISLHAKFQANRSIRLGEKRKQTHRNTQRNTDIYT